MSDHTRSLGFAGATNFRDLGGYPGHGGRAVRWRRLFRSDQLASLTETDIQRLRELGLRRAIDLRGTEERLPAYQLEGLQVHSLPIEPRIVSLLTARIASGEPLSSASAAELMQDSYRSYVRDNTPSFRALLRHLVDDGAPLVFHCTAGKDRTGFAAALVLTALGVPNDAIVEDYLLTNKLWHPPEAVVASPFSDDVKATLISVEASFLSASFEAIRADYGDVDAYLSDGLGLGPRERATLAAHYLEP